MHSITIKRNKFPLFIFVIMSVIVALSFVFVQIDRPFAASFETSAKSAIVIERTSGKVLYEKNADQKLPIASTTKILTAITVIENSKDVNEVVTVPDCAVGIEGSSIYLTKGEKLRIIDLLYGLMLQSGNDCAVALACLTSGSIERFSLLMNAVAARAGAHNSHFANPHGLPDDNHYSTARDMAAISAYAMKNALFREIVGTENYRDCPSADGGRRYIHNKNKILTMLDGGNGIKTGYTKAAGRCLVSSAERNSNEVICVVLSCGAMFEESCALINAAFEKLKGE